MRPRNTRVTACVRVTHRARTQSGITGGDTNIMQARMHCRIYRYSVLCVLSRKAYINGIYRSKHGSLGVTHHPQCYQQSKTADLPRTGYSTSPVASQPLNAPRPAVPKDYDPTRQERRRRHVHTLRENTCKCR